MKPDAYRLDLETYPLVASVPSRFQDLDPLGHINNVAIGAFYEEARGVLNRKAFPLELRKANTMRMVIADVHIAYLAEAFYPGDLVVGSGILRIGGSSYTIGQGLFQNGQCIGASESVLVNTDGKKPAPIPDEGRTALEALMIKPV
ncbi:acyl-CoA thioesterase [Oceanicaulis sp.]|jgi:acyl-CoA thioester hydrolase|uniref:acyl-CoA thioesterase n=1 Tax=Oceanicaulis sp. TaxID=1924941 RepID=UPI000D2F67B8